MRTKLIFAGVIALGLAELGLGAFAATSDVGPEYRAYYIDRTTGCLPREVPGTYTLGTTLPLFSTAPHQDFDNILVCGFENSRSDGTWMRGAEGRLRFALGDGPRQDLELRLEVLVPITPRWPSQRLTVLANGQQVGVVTFGDKSAHTVTVSIPKSVPLTSAGLLEVDLGMVRLPEAAPEKKDSRRHSLMVRSLWLGPAA
jgi:hypothetical protein